MKKFYTTLIAVLILSFLTACGREQDPNVKVYKDNEIFIRSWHCGCLGGDDGIPNDAFVLIETEEQLAFAEDKYKLSEMSNYFVEMFEQNSLEQYSYLISYDEFSTEGYYRHADKVKISDTYVVFGMDWKSHDPKNGPVPQAFDGFIHIAAIPKEYLEGCDYSDIPVVRPGE